VAETRAPSGERAIAAVGRLSRDRDGRNGAEFALLVADAWQRRGVGRALLKRLVEVARREGLARIYADILLSNTGMQHLCDQLGFTVDAMPDAGVLPAVLELGTPLPA
jgi:acetyltransferase